MYQVSIADKGNYLREILQGTLLKMNNEGEECRRCLVQNDRGSSLDLDYE